MNARTETTGQTRFEQGKKAQTQGWRRTLLGAGRRIFGVAGLDVVLPTGARVSCDAPKVATVRFKTPRAVMSFLLGDQMGMFEAFMDQEVDIDPLPGDDAAAALMAVIRVLDERWTDFRFLSAAVHSSRYFWQQNTEARCAKLAVHYSVPEEFWLAFMSKEYPIYSHYLFQEDETWVAWETACERKLDFAMRVCKMRSGDRVLNIGEGWGGMMTYAGRRGMRYTGLTLNEESYKACVAKREKEKLTETCEVIRTDFYYYRSDTKFDAITNMGVTEHLTDYDGLMAQYAQLLRTGGHVYSDFVGTTRDSPFRSMIQKHVYPGATAVYLPKFLNAAARNGFDVLETHDDRSSYDKTCEAWARNVEQNRDLIASKFGERRYRWMWSYLWMCVYGFRTYSNGITGTRVVLRRR
jgi:cyclopropane fatty-acyl-phospholipid synthase-like methyltransferase